MRPAHVAIAVAACAWGATSLAMVLVGPDQIDPGVAPAPMPRPAPVEPADVEVRMAVEVEPVEGHVSFLPACGEPEALAWAPDGTALVFAGGPERNRLCLVEVAAELRSIGETEVRWSSPYPMPEAEITSLAWTPDARHVWFSAATNMERAYEVDRESGANRRLVPSGHLGAEQSHPVAVNDDFMALLSLRDDEWRAVLATRAGRQVSTLAAGAAAYGMTGAHGRFAWTSVTGRSHRVMVSDPDGGLRRVARAWTDLRAAFVDGDTVAVHTTFEDLLDVYDLDSTIRQTLSTRAVVGPLARPEAWPGEGGWLVWQEVDEPNRAHVWSDVANRRVLVDLEGIEPTNPALAFAGDRARLAYTARDTEGRRRLYLADLTEELAELR